MRIAILFIVLTILFGCRKPTICEEPLDVNVSSLQIIFKDSISQKYLYSEINPILSKDSLLITNQFGGTANLITFLSIEPVSHERYWEMNIGPLYEKKTQDTVALKNVYSKNYYIKYSHNKFDTLKLVYKVKIKECGSVFEILKIYNKGELIMDLKDDTFGLITIKKI